MDAVRSALRDLGREAVFLDQRRNSSMRVRLKPSRRGDVNGSISSAGEVLNLGEIGSAYIRPIETRKAMPEPDVEGKALQHAIAVDTTLIAWSDLTSAQVVNRPSAMASNHSKPYQASLIRNLGFRTPRTLITTDPAAASQFVKSHACVVYKSISGVRSVVSRLSGSDPEALQDVANCPTQFQEYIDGHEVRVHVVGRTTISTKIDSGASDYRYAHLTDASVTMEPIAIDESLSAKCVKMASAMGLHLAGIDFRVSPSGDWYCLEVNPSPGFTFYEAATGQAIGRAVAELLCELAQENCGDGTPRNGSSG